MKTLSDELSASGSTPIEAPPRDQAAVIGAGAGGLGAALAAGFAALCCVGPSTVALLGVGGAVAAAGLGPYRPALLVGSLALLAFGFWGAYGRRTMVAGASCPIRVGRVARLILWFSAAIWAVSALIPSL